MITIVVGELVTYIHILFHSLPFLSLPLPFISTPFPFAKDKVEIQYKPLKVFSNTLCFYSKTAFELILYFQRLRTILAPPEALEIYYISSNFH